MSKCRVIGAGASLGRANRGGGFNTACNQGGGNKKQGLVTTTNMRVGLVPYVRTRADGGNARNWVFCVNQLGGVGRRWGQAAGPGNRGGVSASCHFLADLSRSRYPRRPSQSSGHGPPSTFRATPPRTAVGAPRGLSLSCKWYQCDSPYCGCPGTTCPGCGTVNKCSDCGAGGKDDGSHNIDGVK